jgi:hypothetical protein
MCIVVSCNSGRPPSGGQGKRVHYAQYLVNHEVFPADNTRASSTLAVRSQLIISTSIESSSKSSYDTSVP